MKKLLIGLLAVILLLAVFTISALAEDVDSPMIDYDAPELGITSEGAEEDSDYFPVPEPVSTTPGEPLTWAYLATIVGATAATLLIVQYFKTRLDKVWKIPTRVFVYMIALVILLLATHFTKGLTVNTAILTVFNAFIVAAEAYGAYELTFAKVDARADEQKPPDKTE